jgi:PAS domain S-box-containing protein
MPQDTPPPMDGLDEHTALKTILEGTATEVGQPFFAALVKSLAGAMNTKGSWVTEYIEESRRLRMLAYWVDGAFANVYEYDLSGTPCEQVVDKSTLVHFSRNLMSLFPNDPDLKSFGAESYMGVPLLDLDGTILGNLAVQDTHSMPRSPERLAVMRIFAARAAAELQRLRAEKEIREREQQLSSLVNSAMDAIIEIDQHQTITRVNPAAEKAFKCAVDQMNGQSFLRFLSSDAGVNLARCIRALDERPEGERSLWIPGGLTALYPAGDTFPAEATLSRYEMDRHVFYILILRNVNERLEAEQKIHSLTAETAYLREEIRALQSSDEIVGQSEQLMRVLREVQQVAETDASVLILGETGTGKELIARAIHRASRRRDKPLIRVNCAAIPASLIESEFFGHEKGAFTGATTRRDGRFALADSGTIFLDEIGELPIDLQVKLLRVLHEGEFEPVGSSTTRKVNVRVIAATNRDLSQEIRDGRFREDLYYRLNVFPITVPPLRERGEDIVLLASAFAKTIARNMGRSIEPLSPEHLEQLRRYSWPGNIRELRNVIERAVITSRDGQLNLDRAFPEMTGDARTVAAPEETGDRIHTMQELQALERNNIIRALEARGWTVSGDHGAAVLLDMHPSTLASRMKALRIKRPE